MRLLIVIEIIKIYHLISVCYTQINSQELIFLASFITSVKCMVHRTVRRYVTDSKLE